MMSGEDRITTWVGMQKRVWHGDTQSKANTIILKRRATDECIFRCPADAENIPEMVKEALALQAAELPKGSHAFMLLAHDASGAQLSELPQTIKGASTEASNAASEALAMQNAAAKALANIDFANQVLQRNLGTVGSSLLTSNEDRSLLLDALNEERSTNHSMQLERERLHRRWEREDKILESLLPAASILIEHFAKKALANPELMSSILGATKHVPATTTEPTDPAGPSVHVTGSGTLAADGQVPSQGSGGIAKAGRKGNGRAIPA